MLFLSWLRITYTEIKSNKIVPSTGTWGTWNWNPICEEHDRWTRRIFIHSKRIEPPNQPQPFNLYTGISKNRISSERVEAVSKPKNKKNQRTPHPLNPSSQVTRACKKSHGLVVIVSIVIPFAITDVQIVRLPKMIKLAWLFSIKSNPRLPFPTPM